jgi:hypothetical protein
MNFSIVDGDKISMTLLVPGLEPRRSPGRAPFWLAFSSSKRISPENWFALR